jgi:hypothetical protein
VNVPRRVLRTDVEVEMAVGLAIVGVLVPVERPGAQGSEQDVAAEEDQHQGHHRLQSSFHLGRDGELEGDDDHPSGQEGHRMSGPPEGAQQA